MKARFLAWVAAIVPLWTTAAHSESADTYSFDAAASTLEVRVFSGGALGIFGHDHRISAKQFSGTITYGAGRVDKSSVALSVQSGSLIVLDPDASDKDRREIQAAMQGPRVLDVAAFPDISFRSTSLNNVKQTGQQWDGTVVGILKLHGIEQSVTLPVRVQIGTDRLNARGEVFISQKAFGMTPISLAGGTVRVKDRVKITFDIVAARRAG